MTLRCLLPAALGGLLLPSIVLAQTLPTAPVGTDPVHNSPITMHDFVWFTQPGHWVALDSEASYTTDASISRQELAAAMVPADPAVRYANFKPRIGTVLTTDDPRTWNWDRSDRAQMQDAYYQLLAPSWDQLPVWSNSIATHDQATGLCTFTKPGDPGTTDAAWRDAVYTHLNFARYLNFGAQHVRYVAEDPAVLPWVQSATYWMIGNSTVLHSIDPTTPYYSDLAAQGCYQSSLDADLQTASVSVWTYLVEPGNVYPGHRIDLLNEGATRVAVGSAVDGSVEGYGKNALWVRTPGAGAPPVQETDPLKAATVYPFPGYLPCTLFADSSLNGGGNSVVKLQPFDVLFSITFNGPNAFLSDATVAQTGMTVTVTRNGVAVPVRSPGWTGQTFHYIVNLAWDSTQTPGSAGYYAQLDPSGFGDDQTFVVTFHGIQFLDGGLYFPVDSVALTPRDYSYTFTLFNPTKVVQKYPSQVSNIVGISGRSIIGMGDKVEVAGFAITGTEPMRVAIRAQGPGLSQFGIKAPAASTQIKLYQITGDGTNPTLGTNAAWKQGANWRLLLSDHLSPSQENEGALVATLPPGMYTAEVSDPTGQGGVGIAEIYAIDTVSKSQLTGISTRATVGTGEQALVAGFQLTKAMTVMIRTQGPSLSQLGVADPVQATKLTLVRLSDQATLATNAGWKVSDYENSRFTGDLASSAPGSTKEAAVVLHLEPGQYTASAEAADGNAGVGIVEVYQVPDAS